ncbi:hypothetical protein [Rhizobium cremeum]|uniref:hypothetical protein n=1 Tax=Rhizobium cremeum TaxID=2813827 RepID=UPI0013B02BEA
MIEIRHKSGNLLKPVENEADFGALKQALEQKNIGRKRFGLHSVHIVRQAHPP